MDKRHRKQGKKIQDPSVKISKQLSYLLRHGAEQEGLQIGTDGYVSLDQILSRHDFKGVTVKQIEDVVANNDKQRFQIITKVCTEKGINGRYIRATQGHSIKGVQDDDLLEPLTDFEKYPVVVHGTYQQNWLSIRESGLKPMSRNHVHFAIGYPKDDEVISGMRSSCDLYIEINLEKAIKSGMKWYISPNKVILSSGHNRVIEPIYFKKVIDKTGKVIFDSIDENWEEVHLKDEEKQKKLQQQREEAAADKNLLQDSLSSAPPMNVIKQSSNISDNWEEIKEIKKE